MEWNERRASTERAEIPLSSLDVFEVAPELQNEVVTLVGSTRSSIVECEADKFGCR